MRDIIEGVDNHALDRLIDQAVDEKVADLREIIAAQAVTIRKYQQAICWMPSDPMEIEARIEEAVRKEREACAKICEELAEHPSVEEHGYAMAEAIYTAIRARGEK